MQITWKDHVLPTLLNLMLVITTLALIYTTVSLVKSNTYNIEELHKVDKKLMENQEENHREIEWLKQKINNLDHIKANKQ